MRRLFLTSSLLLVTACAQPTSPIMEICDGSGCRSSDRRVDTKDYSAENLGEKAFTSITYRGEDIAVLKTQAESGDAKSAYLLGLVHLHGLAEQKKNPKQAYFWFSQAAEGGLADGQYQTGAMLLQGQGVKKDSAKAVRLLHAAADAGEPRALWTLGTLFAQGEYVQKNQGEAFRFFKQAADAGMPQAMHNVGLMYSAGKGVNADPYQAMVYLKKAAEHNVQEAQRALGFLHARGLEGFPEDLPEARRWLSKAAARGDEEAQKELDIVQGKIARDARYHDAPYFYRRYWGWYIYRPYWVLYPYRYYYY